PVPRAEGRGKRPLTFVDSAPFSVETASPRKQRGSVRLGGARRDRLAIPPKTNAANERLAQHLWNHRDELFTFLRQPGLDATNWRAELAIRFGVILRKVWGGSRTWAGARAQSVLMSVWRVCWPRNCCIIFGTVHSS